MIVQMDIEPRSSGVDVSRGRKIHGVYGVVPRSLRNTCPSCLAVVALPYRT